MEAQTAEAVSQIINTHLPLDKMATISQTMFSDAFSRMKFRILIKISLKFVPKSLTDNNPALV